MLVLAISEIQLFAPSAELRQKTCCRTLSFSDSVSTESVFPGDNFDC